MIVRRTLYEVPSGFARRDSVAFLGNSFLILISVSLITSTTSTETLLSDLGSMICHRCCEKSFTNDVPLPMTMVESCSESEIVPTPL